MNTVKTSYFYHDKPLFGLDIGHGSLKVVQVSQHPVKAGKKAAPPRVIGYGFAEFDKAAQVDGVVVQPEIIAAAAHDLFAKHLVGDITTRRVAIAIPTYRTFTRSLKLPKLKPSELTAAIQLEAEQYISVPLDELYLDYEVVRKSDDSTELFLVAVPKTIVDSYLDLARILGLETVLIEPTLSSSGRLFKLDTQSDVASVLIDFGSLSADISIFDQHMLAAGTVQAGGENFTTSIQKNLGVTASEAALIKTRYGLGVSKKQDQIIKALEPTLQQVIKEIRRMIRYYEERYQGQADAKRPIGQVMTMGGGANIPGLSDYLTNALRLAVRHTDPWLNLNTKGEGLQLPPAADRAMYATAVGLSLIGSKEVFAK